MSELTKDTALESLLSIREEIVRKLPDRELADLLSKELVRGVFGEAWRLQFEDDGQQFVRAVRDLVEDTANCVKP